MFLAADLPELNTPLKKMRRIHQSAPRQDKQLLVASTLLTTSPNTHRPETRGEMLYVQRPRFVLLRVKRPPGHPALAWHPDPTLAYSKALHGPLQGFLSKF